MFIKNYLFCTLEFQCARFAKKNLFDNQQK